MKTIIILLALCAPAAAQSVVVVQPQPVVAWQVQWQPVWVPGQYVAAPRVLPILDCVFGPRVYWQPLPVVVQQPITQQTQ